MSAPGGDLSRLAAQFATLSLLAIGGVNAMVPQIHRDTVELAGWMSDRQFTHYFALAQITPGPNTLLVTYIGFHVAGVAGALVATAATIGPSCLLTFFAARAWARFEHTRWRALVQAALVPVSIGLIAASALVLARAADINAMAFVITLATALVTFFSRASPLWMFALAAVLGYVGLV